MIVHILRCGLTHDPAARTIEIPHWMFDAGVCGLMKLVLDPVVCVESLHELKELLRHARGRPRLTR